MESLKLAGTTVFTGHSIVMLKLRGALVTTKKDSLFAAICEYEECQNVIGTFETKKQAIDATTMMEWQRCCMAGICESRVKELFYFPTLGGWFSLEAAYNLRKAMANKTIRHWLRTPAGMKTFSNLYSFTRFGEAFVHIIDSIGEFDLWVKTVSKVRKPKVKRIKNENN